MKDGDYIRLGEYELLVSIDAATDFPPEEGAIVAYDGGTPSAAVKKSTADDIGADLDLCALLEPGKPQSAAAQLGARNAYGQEAAGAALPAAATDNEGTPWHMLTRPLSVERALAPGPRAQHAAQATLHDGDVDAGLSAFCRGAGIDPRVLSPEARTASLQLAGQLLRETVLGLMDLNQSRTEFRNRMQIPSTAADAHGYYSEAASADALESSFSLPLGVDESLVRLLTARSTRGGPVETVRDNFRELKAQNAATLAAMHSALTDLLDRFEPKGLEERFERGTKRGVFGSQNKAKYWESYAELFTTLSRGPPDGFPHLFAEAFANAYEAKLRTLVPPRRTAFGGDPESGEGPPAKLAGDI
jgi:predicted component of type VI protein secretion system